MYPVSRGLFSKYLVDSRVKYPARTVRLKYDLPGEILNKIFLWEAPLQGPLLTLLHTIFGRKSTPFIYLLLTNGTPFTYLA